MSAGELCSLALPSCCCCRHRCCCHRRHCCCFTHASRGFIRRAINMAPCPNAFSACAYCLWSCRFVIACSYHSQEGYYDPIVWAAGCIQVRTHLRDDDADADDDTHKIHSSRLIETPRDFEMLCTKAKDHRPLIVPTCVFLRPAYSRLSSTTMSR